MHNKLISSIPEVMVLMALFLFGNTFIGCIHFDSHLHTRPALRLSHPSVLLSRQEVLRVDSVTGQIGDDRRCDDESQTTRC